MHASSGSGSKRRFTDRRQAGRELAHAIGARSLPAHPVVLALPRGGVPVAFEVAQHLRAPLDVLVVRSLAVSGHPELAVGVIAGRGVRVREAARADGMGVTEQELARLAAREQAELERHERLYRQGRAPLPIRERPVVLIDDGLDTGISMLAAARVAHNAGAGPLLVAAPVASARALALLRAEVDDVLVLQSPSPFIAIGEWYQQYEPIDDEEVIALLAR